MRRKVRNWSRFGNISAEAMGLPAGAQVYPILGVKANTPTVIRAPITGASLNPTVNLIGGPAFCGQHRNRGKRECDISRKPCEFTVGFNKVISCEIPYVKS